MARKHVDFTITDFGIQQDPSGGEKTSSPLLSHPASLPSGSAERPGVNRAAKLLLALGPDRASHILKELEEPEIEVLVQEMVRIKRISSEEKKSVLKEFERTVQNQEEPVQGGLESTREILTRGLGEKRASEILSRLNRQDLKKDFEFLERLDPRMLAGSLHQEHPQIAAVALSFIHPKIAASVMKFLSDDYRSQVAVRIARTSTTHPDSLERVAKVLREKFEKRKEEIYSDTGGAETLANILNHLDRQLEEDLLSTLGRSAPDLLESVKERLYTFEELINLDTKETRLLLSRVNDDIILATALRGAGEELRRHFFNALSQNRAADVLEEMDHRGPVSIREVNDARAYILNVARKMDEEGTLVIKKEKEEYI